MTVKKIFRNIDRDNRMSADTKKAAQKSVSYGVSGVDDNIEEYATMNSTSAKASLGDVIYNVGTENVHAVVVGCNSNNDNSSARTVNANNAVSNGNDNYAGRFALPERETCEDTESGIARKFRRTCTTCSARTNITEKVIGETEGVNPNDLLGLLRDEYNGSNAVSESHANTLPMGDNDCNVNKSDIWEELSKANHKRHLKDLKRFLVNREIVTAAVERCLKRASNSKQKRKAIKHKEEIINRIIDELTNETYHVGKVYGEKTSEKR